MSQRFALVTRHSVEELGRVIVTVTDRGNPIGTVNLSRQAYIDMSRQLLVNVAHVVLEVISKELPEMIWRDALARKMDEEAAKKLIEDQGWTDNGRIGTFAQELTTKIVNELMERMP